MPLIDLSSPTVPVQVRLPDAGGTRPEAEAFAVGAEAQEPEKPKVGVAKPAVTADMNVVLIAYAAVAVGAAAAIGLRAGKCLQNACRNFRSVARHLPRVSAHRLDLRPGRGASRTVGATSRRRAARST